MDKDRKESAFLDTPADSSAMSTFLIIKTKISAHYFIVPEATTTRKDMVRIGGEKRKKKKNLSGSKRSSGRGQHEWIAQHTVLIYLDRQSASADCGIKRKIQEEEELKESTTQVWVTGTTTGIYLTSRRREGKTDDDSGKSTESSPFHFFFLSSSSSAELPSDNLFFLTAFAFVRSL